MAGIDASKGPSPFHYLCVVAASNKLVLDGNNESERKWKLLHFGDYMRPTIIIWGVKIGVFGKENGNHYYSWRAIQIRSTLLGSTPRPRWASQPFKSIHPHIYVGSRNVAIQSLRSTQKTRIPNKHFDGFYEHCQSASWPGLYPCPRR